MWLQLSLLWQQQARFDFVAQGEPATSMFFISRGDVCVFVIEDTPTAGGRIECPEETYIISLGTGSFFGEVALLGEVRVVARCRLVESHNLCLRGWCLEEGCCWQFSYGVNRLIVCLIPRST